MLILFEPTDCSPFEIAACTFSLLGCSILELAALGEAAAAEEAKASRGCPALDPQLALHGAGVCPQQAVGLCARVFLDDDLGPGLVAGRRLGLRAGALEDGLELGEGQEVLGFSLPGGYVPSREELDALEALLGC
eukprot:scaffold250173_cov40-Prasinocladus_malaysianus.AAC.1